jgi:iron complex transport system substrate-binding protein
METLMRISLLGNHPCPDGRGLLLKRTALVSRWKNLTPTTLLTGDLSRMKRFFPLLVMILALSLTLAACAPAPAAAPANSAAPISLTDGLGREVTLAGPAQAVISLAPSNTEILFAVGAGEQVIAREQFSNYPEAALALPSIGDTQDQNLEEIVRLQPDLVLASDLNAPEQIKAIEDLGITVFSLANPTDLEGLYENMRIVATLTGHQAEAEAWIESAKQRVAVVEEVIQKAETTPKVFYELDATDPSSPWTSGGGTFIDTLISMAGGQNIAGTMNTPWAEYSQEELILQDPHIILLGDSMWGVTPEQVSTRPGWDKITAVVENRVLPFNDDLVSRPGPRLIDGLEALARAIHPELFAE